MTGASGKDTAIRAQRSRSSKGRVRRIYSGHYMEVRATTLVAEWAPGLASEPGTKKSLLNRASGKTAPGYQQPRAASPISPRTYDTQLSTTSAPY